MKGNIIDLLIHRHDNINHNTIPTQSISQELVQAIQNLIYRLRELGPITPMKFDKDQ